MELDELLPIIYKIRYVSKRNTDYIDSQLKDHNAFSGDFQFLYLIYSNEKATQKLISDKLGYNESTTTRGLKRLENKGFIKREKDSEDKRKNILSLTPKGCEMLKLNLKVQLEFENNIEGLFTDEELEKFKEYLKRAFLNLK